MGKDCFHVLPRVIGAGVAVDNILYLRDGKRVDLTVGDFSHALECLFRRALTISR
nr:MAG: hypothetical protein [Bacteriophage sp.]